MEEKPLNEKESLELITQMIRNTQKKMEKGSGLPFLIWGYVTIAVSLAVWTYRVGTERVIAGAPPRARCISAASVPPRGRISNW